MSRWARGFLADWQLKLLGLGIAVALWAYVHGLQSLELTLSVPLELRNPPRSMRLARRPPLEKPRRSLLPVLLDIPLHADRADPKGPHNLCLTAIAIDHHLTGEHRKARPV